MRMLRQYWPTLIVLGVIMYATFASSPVMADELPAIPHLDKLIHAVMMGGLLSAFTFDWQRCHRQKKITPKFILMVFAGVILFSIADECVQGALHNGRSAEALDLLADTVGASVAAFTAPPAIRKVLGIDPSKQS